MDMLGVVFPTILYILGSILLIVLIIFVVKAIASLDKLNVILDDVNGKVKSLNGLFNAIDAASSFMNSIGDRAIELVANIIGKFNKPKRKNKKRKEEDTNE